MNIKSLKNHKTIPLKVTPKAACNSIKLEDSKDGTTHLKVCVTAIPEKGEANKQVIKLVAKFLDIAPSKLHIKQGATSKNKLLKIID